MPRLPPALIRQAASENRYLPLLLRVCRDLSSARNELRWLHEHACDTVASSRHRAQYGRIPTSSRGRRSSGEAVSSSVNGNVSVNIEGNTRIRRSSDGVHSTAARLDGRHVRNRYFSTTHILKEDATSSPNRARGTIRLKLPACKDKPNEADSDRSFRSHGYRKRTAHRGLPARRHETKPPADPEPTIVQGESLEDLPAVKEEEREPTDAAAVGHEPRDPAAVGGEDITAGFPMPEIGLHTIPDLDDELQKHPSPSPNRFRSCLFGPEDTAANTGDLQSKSIGEDPSHHEVEKFRVRKFLSKSISDRTSGMPLQYILGTQPFGNLIIRTPKGVLIPRPETESYTEHIAEYLRFVVGGLARDTGSDSDRKVRILDLCTGTGCMGLLVHSILKPAEPATRASPWVWPEHFELEVLGVDYSSRCVAVANYNLQRNLEMKLLHPDAKRDISFREGDVLKLAKMAEEGDEVSNGLLEFLNDRLNAPGERSTWDVIIANPPYISPRDYAPGGRTESSVRKYEPKLALVPDDAPSVHPGDLFYWPLFRVSRAIGAKLLVMEVGDSDQAYRVHNMVGKDFRYQATLKGDSMLLQCWKDDGSVKTLRNRGPRSGPRKVKSPEEASDRAIFLFTGTFAEWRRKTSYEIHFSEEATSPHSEGIANMQDSEDDAELTGNSHSARDKDREQNKGSPAQEQTSIIDDADPDTPSAEVDPAATQTSDEIAPANGTKSSKEAKANRKKSEAIRIAVMRLKAAFGMEGSVDISNTKEADILEPVQRIAMALDNAAQEYSAEKHEKKVAKPLPKEIQNVRKLTWQRSRNSSRARRK
ncbi:hypothetical protein EDD37DRAFT_459556 [Exophiala viscosa]|uniref:uncharacterized protein n=1 Tax=Exophiala viscosa TaxID=2486360 RepID=UPI00218EB193|nr:hypothetical protein EDD37DRAFT_459556 [Exophiala viscosa]